MATGVFQGQLNANEIFAAIYNMIISQQVFSDNIKGTYNDLASRFKVDGTLYGDTKLYYATDALKSREWLGDAEAANLLALHRPQDPEVQYVTIDQFRIIPLTVDNYLTKRAWSTEGAFSAFNSVMLGWMAATKKVFESRLINTFIGNTKSNANKNTITVDLTSASSGDPLYGVSGEEKNRMEAGYIAQSIADLLVDLKDTTRDYNDYGYLRSYTGDDLLFIWNSAYVNKIKKLDLPTMFHKDGLIDKFEDDILPQRYFGRATTASDVTASTGVVDDTIAKVHSLIETDVTVNSVEYHLFPGDIIPNGATVISGGDFELNQTYVEDDSIICKVVHKSGVPFMGAFSTNTSFYNPISLTENHYLIWGYSEPTYLYNYPFLTIEANV